MYSHSPVVNSHPPSFGGDLYNNHQNENGRQIHDGDGANAGKIAPSGTFEKTSFDQLMSYYDHKHDLPPTLELTQAFLMTQNMSETASRVTGLTAGGSGYFLKNDYVGDTMRNSEAMQSVSRLLGNLGTSDKASNFILEQRNLMRAQAKENREIRDLINEKIVDGLEYIRVKESLAETKERVKELLDQQFTSDEEAEQQAKKLQNGHKKSGSSSDTDEDSEEAQKNKKLTDLKIKGIINQIRKDAKEYLNLSENNPVDSLSLHTIWKKLRRNQRYRKKRDQKALSKGIIDTIKLVQDQLNQELKDLENKTSQINNSKQELQRAVSQYEWATSSNKQQKLDRPEKSVSEIDTLPMNAKSFELQTILFNFCGISLRQKPKTMGKVREQLFGNIKKLPSKSALLQSYQDQGENKSTLIQNENYQTAQARKKNHELVKVIGLQPEQLFQTLEKYKISTVKLPKFSNVFERAEPIIPGLGMTVAGSLISGNQTGQMSFARVDGRNVISLQFNPYELDEGPKKKVYDQAMKEIIEQRDKIKTISKQAREKQELSNIKRAWLNIVKKDIPKAFRGYQKYKTDLENNTKKQSQNCQKEVRKKALKTQRLQKETVMRAKKLTREMMNYWRKRDKEIADQKRKKEKIEKENRRKLEEEKELMLQKKRLEFIMQQSEIYAHFMSKKLGLAEEQQKQRFQDIDEEKKDNFARVQIDEDEAKQQVAQIINEDRQRVNKFDSETFTKKDKILTDINEEELEIEKFDNPDPSSLSDVIQAPSCFKGALKHYQLKGLRWLDNLYEQGINGILADEMGLGKTIQAIVLLAHLYETKQVWGPFLVVVPVTTLHNWQNELAKFCPNLKVLPYFGSPEERKKLGRFLDPKNLYNPNCQINVLLTSYNLLVNNPKDQAKLMKVKWNYMILDEAQAIKNNMSRRWKILLQFQARNRLLLTGTPIQNSMAELWALLHFIMPKLFDSHEQFQEWFSKDIEQSSMNQGEISKHQLKRLHLVLKPFMLRRLKKDVEQEIGPKVEYEKYCQMTHRQRVLYQRIKNKISTKDLFQLAENKQKFENLMNLVMQFRKVCNHPELFERRIGRIPFAFRVLQHGMQLNPAFSNQPDIRASMTNPISYELPKLLFDECFIHSDNQTQLFTKLRKGLGIEYCQVGIETHMKFFNIFNVVNLHKECFTSNSGFGILRLLAKSNNWSLGELSYIFVADPLMKQIALMHHYQLKHQRNQYTNIHNSSKSSLELNFNSIGTNTFYNPGTVEVNIVDFVKRDKNSLLYRQNIFYDEDGVPTLLQPLIPEDKNVYTNLSRELRKDLDIFVYTSQAEPIEYLCRSSAFKRFITSVLYSSMHKKVLIGKDFKPRYEVNLGRIGRDRSSFLTEDTGTSWKQGPPRGYSMIENGVLRDIVKDRSSTLLELPHYNRLVTDCGKMQFLDKLLKDLHKQNHRVLIFCQMTRMLDILEDFLSWKKYTYFRMDGSTSIQDRRYMVEEYQKNPDIFAFLLSTRAGGLGVNLTAADTVVFYDNDWNPTMDAQATDRAHRIGQTKTVSVYRIITKGTVEEKIVKRAKQKQSVQSTVYGGNALKADVFKPKDVVEMLLDDQETNTLKERQAKFLKTKRVKKAFRNNDNSHEGPSHKRTAEDKHDREGITSPKAPIIKEKPLKEEKEKQKPGRKPAAEKPAKTPQNIFSTVKSGSDAKQSAGPFSVTKASMPLFAVSKSQAALTSNPEQDEEMAEYEEYEEEGEEDEIEEEDAIGAEKLLQLLEKNDDESESDDENGVAFEFDEDEAGPVKTGTNGGTSKDKKKATEEDDDDEMMEEY